MTPMTTKFCDTRSTTRKGCNFVLDRHVTIIIIYRQLDVMQNNCQACESVCAQECYYNLGFIQWSLKLANRIKNCPVNQSLNVPTSYDFLMYLSQISIFSQRDTNVHCVRISAKYVKVYWGYMLSPSNNTFVPIFELRLASVHSYHFDVRVM